MLNSDSKQNSRTTIAEAMSAQMTDDPAQIISSMVGSIREAVDRLAEQARQIEKQLTPLMCAAKAGDEAAVLRLL